MKVLNIISVASLAVVMAACGSNQNQGYYSNQAYGNNYAGGLQATSSQYPIYGSNGQIAGYKIRTPIVGGVFSNITGGSFQQSVMVNAGDRLFINLANASYGVSRAFCDGKIADKITTGNRTFPLSNLSLSLNGQSIGAGYGSMITAPSSGSLVISAILNPVTVSCGWLFNNRPAQVISYVVNLGGAGYNGGFYGSGATVEVERCTNVQGAAINCPY